MPRRSFSPPSPTTNWPSRSSHTFVLTAIEGSVTASCAVDPEIEVFARLVGFTTWIIAHRGTWVESFPRDDMIELVRRTCAGLLVSLLVVCPAPASAADAGLPQRMGTPATHSPEGPARLEAGRPALEAAVASQPSVGLLVILAQISYVWGD